MDRPTILCLRLYCVCPKIYFLQIWMYNSSKNCFFFTREVVEYTKVLSQIPELETVLINFKFCILVKNSLRILWREKILSEIPHFP